MRNLVTSPTTYTLLITGLLWSIPLPYAFSTGMLVALLAVALLSLRFHSPEWKWEFFIPVGFYLFMVVSLLWTINTKQSLRGLERELALVILPVAFVCMPKLTRNTQDKILYVFSVGVALYALFFMMLALGRVLKGESASTFFYHGLVSPAALNAIYVSVITSLCLLFLAFKSKKTPLNLMVLGILALFLLLLSSKTIIITTFLVGMFGVFQTFRTKARILSVVVLLIATTVFLAFPNPVKERFDREIAASNIPEVLSCEKFNKVYDWTGTTIRLFQARIFFEMLQEDEAFLKGYGINASQEKIIEKQKAYNLWQGYYSYNFHNQYLQAFSELGVVGLLCIFLLLGVLLKRYKDTRDFRVLALFCIMLAVFVTESYLWRQRGLFHFLVLFCLFFKAATPVKSLPDQS